MQVFSSPSLEQVSEIARMTGNNKMLNIPVVVTHDGIFHAHEVFAVAILSPMIVFRTRNEEIISIASKQETWRVIDIGNINEGNVRDHHQHRGYHDLSSMFFLEGLRLSDPLKMILESIAKIDCKIESIDIVSSIVSSFNPSWDETLDRDLQFSSAVNFAGVVLNNPETFIEIALRSTRRETSKSKAFPIVREAINRSNDGILCLDTYVPWMEPVLKHNDTAKNKITFVIYPDINDATKTRLHAVPISANERSKNRCDIVSITGKNGCLFLHKALFTAGYNNKASAIEAARKSMRRQ